MRKCTVAMLLLLMRLVEVLSTFNGYDFLSRKALLVDTIVFIAISIAAGRLT